MSHEPLRATCCGCLQVVVDPPRSGLHPQVIRLLRQVCGQVVLSDVAASPAVLATLTLGYPRANTCPHMHAAARRASCGVCVM